MRAYLPSTSLPSRQSASSRQHWSTIICTFSLVLLGWLSAEHMWIICFVICMSYFYVFVLFWFKNVNCHFKKWVQCFCFMNKSFPHNCGKCLTVLPWRSVSVTLTLLLDNVIDACDETWQVVERASSMMKPLTICRFLGPASQASLLRMLALSHFDRFDL